MAKNTDPGIELDELEQNAKEAGAIIESIPEQNNTHQATSIEGERLHFDEVKFRQTKERAEMILPSINSLIAAYKQLELDDPFDQEMFERFVAGSGPSKELLKFNHILNKDLEGFESPVSKSNLVQRASEWAESIYTLARIIKKDLDAFSPPISSYSLSVNDFKIENEQVSVVTDAMEKHFSIYVTKKQAEVYEQLQKVANAYNGLIEYFKEEGFEIGGRSLHDHFSARGNSIMDTFFEKEVIEKASSVGSYDITSPYISVKKQTIGSAAFK